jgi:hypothetical protein
MVNILFEINDDTFPKNLHIEHIEYVEEENQYINLTQEAMSMAMWFAIEKLGLSHSDFGVPEDEDEYFESEFICKINNQLYKVGYSSTYHYEIEEIKIN